MDTAYPALDPHATPFLELAEVQRLVLDAWPALVMRLDLEGRIAYLNPAGATRLGYGRDELTGRALVGSLVPREEMELRATQLAQELGGAQAPDATLFGARLRHGMAADEHDWVLRHKDGSPHPVRLSVAAVRDGAGQVTGLLAVESVAADEEGERLKLLNHDGLTGLPSRAMLADRAEMALQRAARAKTCVALMVVELAGFDALCEAHGHSVGDDVLRATASRLHFELRKTDTAVRLERGRFAAMLVDLHQPDEAARVAEKIRAAVSAPVNVGVARVPLSARVGVAWSPSHGDQLLPLLESAEAALATGPIGKSTVSLAPSSSAGVPGVAG